AQLLRFGFDHQHAFHRTGDNEVEGGGFLFFKGRVDQVFTVLIANARGADRAHKGDAGNGQGGGYADHGDDVRIVFHVMCDDRAHYEDFVVEAFGEEGTDRTVD